MQTVVYVDILIVLNYIINFLLLICLEKISGVPQRRRFTMLSALLGALSSLIIFIPTLNPFLSILYKCATALLMMFAAYGRRPLGLFMKLTLIFFVCTVVFAGACLAFWMITGTQNMLWYNGIVYFDISAVVLIITTTLAYLLLTLFNRIFASRINADQLCALTVEYGGRQITLTGLVDTGNRLVEPFSGLPVVVSSWNACEQLFGPDDYQWFLSEMDDPPPFLKPPHGYRLITYAGVDRDGLIPAIIPDRVTLSTSAGGAIQQKAFIAIAKTSVGDERYNAVLNPQLVRLGVYSQAT